MIYVRVLRKHFESKRQRLYFRVMNIDGSKITHCPCMSLCSMPIALWHIFWNPKIFSHLHLAESEQLDWRQTGQWGANSCSNALFWQWIPLVLTGCMSSQGFPQKNPDFYEKQPKIICYFQSQCCPQPHNHCHFWQGQDIARSTDLLHSRPYTGTREGSDVKHQVFGIECQLKQFVFNVPESKIQLQWRKTGR